MRATCDALLVIAGTLRCYTSQMPYAKRKRTRLRSWDYATAATYFVTVCAYGRKPLFGGIRYDEDDLTIPASLLPSSVGDILIEEIARLGKTDGDCKVLSSVVMPNHVHILVETSSVEGLAGSMVGISDIVARLKRRVTHRAREGSPGIRVWQRGFHDHIVRSDADLARIYEYIENNPVRWAVDRYHIGQ